MEIWRLSPLSRHFPEWRGQGADHPRETLPIRKIYEQLIGTRSAHICQKDGTVRQQIHQNLDTYSNQLCFYRLLRHVLDSSSTLFLLPAVAPQHPQPRSRDTLCASRPLTQESRSPGASSRPIRPLVQLVRLVQKLRKSALVFGFGCRECHAIGSNFDLRGLGNAAGTGFFFERLDGGEEKEGFCDRPESE